MQTRIPALTLIAAALLPLPALADEAAGSWATVAYGRDEAHIPLSDGMQPVLSSETVNKGIYYGAFYRKGESKEDWTTMGVVSVYPQVPKDMPIAPQRTVLEFLLGEDRDNCPPEGFSATIEPVEDGRYGQVVSCRYQQGGKTEYVYEYTMAVLGTDQVITISRMGHLKDSRPGAQPPAQVIAAWRADLRRTQICSRTSKHCVAAGKGSPNPAEPVAPAAPGR